jgi:release factor glutamine methyltransferase
VTRPRGHGAREDGATDPPVLPISGDEAAEAKAPSWRQLLASTVVDLGDRREARLVLETAGQMSQAELMARLDDQVPPAMAQHAATLVGRRRSGEPLQWVVGRWGFRGIDVVVDGRALVPRPETEVVVGEALAALSRAGPPYEVVDLGTGSGVIALAIASEFPRARVLATDVDPEALALARDNLARQDEAVRHRVRLAQGDWFRALPDELAGQCALVVSNPPYLAAWEWPALDPVVRDHDPYGALVAGENGLEALSHLVSEAPVWLHPGGALVTELAPHQGAAMLELVASTGRYVEAGVVDDLAGRPRALVARVAG